VSRLTSASVEIASRSAQIEELRENFDPGLDVTVTFLPGDDYRDNVGIATALRRAGFNPVPHVAAREFTSREALDDYLASDAQLSCQPEKLFQGAIADSFTHVGQLAMLRRLAGAPIRGENYAQAEIVIGRVSAKQTPPRREFD